MIIHISGAPGSGKTTLANKLKRTYKNIIVEDLEERKKREMIKRWFTNIYHANKKS